MSPQKVIRSFMGALANHDYSYSSSVGTQMLDNAVKTSSKYESIQDVIDAMKADQIKAEKEAVEEVLGSDYSGKTMAEVSSDILSADAKGYDVSNVGNAYLNDWNDSRTTVERLIKERKAYIFLEKYCGIQQSDKYWINSSDNITYWAGETTGNVDTGAITGSDANITLKAGDIVGDTTLTAADLTELAEKDDITLSDDGQSIVIGTGIEKTDRSVVPEIGNKYAATTSQGQNINTGSNDWLVTATSSNDTITTGGADSIDAGAGNDKIYIGADHASVLTGAGNDTVEISAEVNNVTLEDLNSNDILTISGTFEVGSAKIEDTMLTVTDKTGTRKIRLGNLESARNSKVNGTTLANWLSNAGFDINNLAASSSGNVIDEPTTEPVKSSNPDGGGQIEADPDYKPTPLVPVTSTEKTQDLPSRSANSTGEINVNLDNATLTSGDLEVDGVKVGEISNEFPGVNSFTKNGLTINLIGTTSNTDGYPDNFEYKTLDQLTDDQKTIVAGLFKWWGKECLKLNEESYGIGFNSPTTMVKEIGLYFYDSKGSGNILATVWNWNSDATTTKLMLNVNMNYYSGIEATNFDGESSDTSSLLDRTLAHEFTHAVMATNVHYFNELPQFIKEGSAELTHGIDDERDNIIFGVAYDADRLNTALDLNNKSTGMVDGYAGGYMFLRYFARQAALQTLFAPDNPLLIIGTEKADSINNTLDGATIQALGGDDYLSNIVDNVSISGGADNDTIYNDAAHVSIDAGDGNDDIYNNGANVTIDGGAGNDSVYNWGESVTINTGAGNDYIDNRGSNVTIDGGTGNDIIYNTSNEVWNYETEQWEIINPDKVTIYSGDGSDTIYNRGSNVTIDAGDGNDSIRNYGSNVTITSGDGNDYIDNNYTTKYNSTTQTYETITPDKVTIDAGAGNDTIKNYGANVLFKYASGDGNDLIQSFNETSTLSIGDGKGTYSATRSDSDLILTVGSGKITLQGTANLSTVNISGTDKTEPV